MLTDPDLETHRQAAYARLGSTDPACIVCGETDWRCLEQHHIAGRAYDALQVILCRNCHRKQSDPATNAPSPRSAPVLEQAGHLLVGLAEFFLELVTRLRQLGADLLDAARACPWPYGWVGAPERQP